MSHLKLSGMGMSMIKQDVIKFDPAVDKSLDILLLYENIMFTRSIQQIISNLSIAVKLLVFHLLPSFVQIALHLKDSWITSLRVAIKTSLRDVGKGWFNIHETNWEVYQISKMKKFMEMVKFNMQVRATS